MGGVDNSSAKHICAFMLPCIDHIGLKLFIFPPLEDELWENRTAFYLFLFV